MADEGTMLAALLLLTLARQNPTYPQEPRFSSLVLTEGVHGGFFGPTVRRRVELGFDWNAGRYRATVYRAADRGAVEGPYSTALLQRQEFEDILRGVRALASLPPQADPDGADVYAMDTRLEFCDGRLFWQNLVSTGCEVRASKVPPTEDEKRVFATVVKEVLDAVAALPLQPGCELDAGFLYRPANLPEASAFLKALEHVLQQPLAPRIDRNRVDVLVAGEQYEFRFAWRDLQDLESSDTRQRRRQSYDVAIDGRTLTLGGVRSTPFEPSAEVLADRSAFLDVHPELSMRFRRLIDAGWIGRGMTAEMVRAAWGPPSMDGLPWLSYERHGKRERLRFDPDGRLELRVPGP